MQADHGDGALPNDDQLNDRQAVPLAAVRYRMPVLDVQGAFLGTIEYVDSDAQSALRLHRCGPRECDLFVASAHISYVADDHVRLSITVDEAISKGRSTASP